MKLAVFVGIVILAVEGYYGYHFYEALRADPEANVAGNTASTGVTGSTEAVVPEWTSFVHRSTLENSSENSTYLDDPLTNGNPDAFVSVTQNWNPGGEGDTYNDHAIGVWYDSGARRWAIFNQDRAAMPEGAAFNVIVRSEEGEDG